MYILVLTRFYHVQIFQLFLFNKWIKTIDTHTNEMQVFSFYFKTIEIVSDAPNFHISHFYNFLMNDEKMLQFIHKYFHSQATLSIYFDQYLFIYYGMHIFQWRYVLLFYQCACKKIPKEKWYFFVPLRSDIRNKDRAILQD